MPLWPIQPISPSAAMVHSAQILSNCPNPAALSTQHLASTGFHLQTATTTAHLFPSSFPTHRSTACCDLAHVLALRGGQAWGQVDGVASLRSGGARTMSWQGQGSAREVRSKAGSRSRDLMVRLIRFHSAFLHLQPLPHASTTLTSD